MTNAEFKKAAKSEGVKIFSIQKQKKGYFISYAYILSPHTISMQKAISVANEDLQEIFENKFLGVIRIARF